MSQSKTRRPMVVSRLAVRSVATIAALTLCGFGVTGVASASTDNPEVSEEPVVTEEVVVPEVIEESTPVVEEPAPSEPISEPEPVVVEQQDVASSDRSEQATTSKSGDKSDKGKDDKSKGKDKDKGKPGGHKPPKPQPPVQPEPEPPVEPEGPTVVVPEVPQCVAGSFVLPSNTDALTYALSSDGTTVRVMSDTATVQAGNGWVVVQGDFGGASVLEFTGTCEPEEPTNTVDLGVPFQVPFMDCWDTYLPESGGGVTYNLLANSNIPTAVLDEGKTFGVLNGWVVVGDNKAEYRLLETPICGNDEPVEPEEPTVVVPEQPVCNKHGETLLPADTDAVKYELDGDAKVVTATIIKPGFTFDENELNGYEVGYVDDETGVVAVLTFDVSDCKPVDNGGGEPNPTNPGGNNGGNQPPANPNPGNNGGGNQPPANAGGTPTPVDNSTPVAAHSDDTKKKESLKGGNYVTGVDAPNTASPLFIVALLLGLVFAIFALLPAAMQDRITRRFGVRMQS